MNKCPSGWTVKTVLPSKQLKSSLEFRINGQTILILNYGSRLELHISTVVNNKVSIEPQISIPLPGPIEHLRFLGENRILVINRKSQFLVLSLSPQGISVMLRGTLEDGIRRPVDSITCVDPLFRFFIYVSAQGVMRLVSLIYRGLEIYLGMVHNCALQELNVIDMAMTLHPRLTDTVILHVLCQESASQYKLHQYWIDWSAPSVFSPERHVTRQSIFPNIQMKQPQKLVVLPNQYDLLLFATDGVSLYTAEDEKHLSVRTALIKYSAFKPISDSMVVCGDVEGKLFVLQRVEETIRMQYLGRTDPFVCLEYLGEALVWCGAAPGFTSQIVHFTSEPNSKSEYLKSIVPWGGDLGSSQFTDACALSNEIVLAVNSSRAPYPPKSALWMIKEGYGCQLTDAVELDTGGAPLTKLFHVTMDETLYFVVADSSGKRVVLDHQFQPADHLETSSLELLRGARGLRMSNRGEFYSFSDRSVFLISPRMELVYKAPPNGNPIKNVDVYEDVVVVHSQNDLTIGPVGFNWKHVIPINDYEIAALTLGRSADEYLLAVIDWKRRLHFYAFTSSYLEMKFQVDLTLCVAPRDVCLLGDGEFILVGDAKGQLHQVDREGVVNVVQLGSGPLKFEPFLDRVIVLSGQQNPSVLSVVHETVILKPLNLPCLSAFVDTGMGSFAAIAANVLITGSIDIENPFGKQISKVIGFEEYCENVCVLEGNAGMMAMATRDELSRIRLISSNVGGQLLDAYTLLPNETVTSLHASNKLEDAPVGDLIIIGTSFASPGGTEYEQLEAEKGRIIILQVTGERAKKLKLHSALEVEGGVNALGVCKGKLIACVNANNCVYKFVSNNAMPSSSPTMKSAVQLQSVTPGQIMGVSMSIYGSRVLVGDLLKSVSLYELQEKRLDLAMNDVSSHWIQTCSIDDDNVILGSDTFGNLILYGEAPDPFISNRKVISVYSGYHLGTPIIRILNTATNNNFNNKLLVGESGQIWQMSKTEQFKVRKRLEEVLAGKLAPLHSHHRQFYAKTPKNSINLDFFVDADLLMRFMELSYKEKEEITAMLGVSISQLNLLLNK